LAEYRKQTIIASVIAIVIALSVGLGVYFTQPTQVSTAPGPGTGLVLNNLPAILIGSQTINSTIGLELSLRLSAATFTPGQSVSINIRENNTQNNSNTVSRETHWPLNGMALGPCGTMNYPFGISVFYGYYDQGNLSLLANQSSMELYQPGVYACPAMFIVNGYSFQPLSDNASLGTLSTGAVTIPMSSVVNTNGSWTGRMVGSTFNEFQPGVFTVVGGDEWGDVAIVHFSVS
jgi:hypothetical protein